MQRAPSERTTIDVATAHTETLLWREPFWMQNPTVRWVAAHMSPGRPPDPVTAQADQTMRCTSKPELTLLEGFRPRRTFGDIVLLRVKEMPGATETEASRPKTLPSKFAHAFGIFMPIGHSL